jgi:pimeloyl-ACP methyl ester carboxylesterase
MATSRSSPPAPDLQTGGFAVDGHSLHWQRAGDPAHPAVVLLHHGLGSTRAWKAQTADFATRGWQVLVYDRWGYGRSAARPALDLPGFGTDVDDLAVLLDDRGIRRAALVGHSDGGTVALYFAARFPERVTALVTVAAHIYLEASMLPGMLALRQAFENDARFRQGMQRAHGENTDAVFRNWYQGWVRPDYLGWDMRPMLDSVRCPVLVIQGEMDEHATPQHARDLAEHVAHGELWLVPGAGHMLPQDKPADFNRRVLEFLEPARAAGSRGS